MTGAFILVRLMAGEEGSVIKAIKQVQGIKNVVAVFGRWDLVVTVEAEDSEELASMVIRKIRGIPGVVTSETMITTGLSKAGTIKS